MPVVMRLLSLADGRVQDPMFTRYLKSVDLNGNNGRGRFVITTHKEDALHFKDAGELLTLWRSQSTLRPLRPDGEPNRPLMSFTIEITEV